MERMLPEPSRSEKVIKGLLTKPSQKPNFSALPPPSILSQIKGFLPQFKESTDAIIADPELAREHLMELDPESAPPADSSKKVIEMDLGVGLFDVAPDAVPELEKRIQSDSRENPHLVYFDEAEDDKTKASPLIQEMAPATQPDKKWKKGYTKKTAKKMKRAKGLTKEHGKNV